MKLLTNRQHSKTRPLAKITLLGKSSVYKTAKKTPKEQGIALVMSIVLLSFCFASLVFAVSLSSLTAKRASHTQYRSYQALLAAESGVNSFVHRATIAKLDAYKHDLSLDGLTTWLRDNELDSLELLRNDEHTIKAALQFSHYSPTAMTLESTGTIHDTATNNLLAKKVLRLDYTLVAAGHQLFVQVPAAITSIGGIHLEDSATLKGATAEEVPSVIMGYDEARASPSKLPNSTFYQLRIYKPESFHTNQTIALKHDIYRVNSVDHQAYSLELEKLAGKLTEVIAPKNTISLLPHVLLAEYQNSDTVLSLSRIGDFTTGQSINLAGYLGNILDITENYLVVDWATTPISKFAVGTPISVGKLAAMSAQEIRSTKDNQLSGGHKSHDTFSIPKLFATTFGLSKDELLGFADSLGQRSGKSFEHLSAAQLYTISTTGLNGLYYLEEDVHFSSTSPLCGEGILITTGNISIDATCETGFSGLIYTMGSYTQSSGEIIGAVVSESNLNSTVLRGDASISYNATAINQWQRHLQDAFANQDGHKSFKQVVGSWRLE